METVHRSEAPCTIVGNGRIVAHHGISVEVLFDGGLRRMVRVKRNSGHVVGDEVSVKGELLTRLPRTTELRRRDARGGVHLVAANLDVLGIVVAPLSPTGFIDRAIVASRAAGLKPFVVINKCDLEEGEKLAVSLRETHPPSVPLFPLSAATGNGLAPLREFFSTGRRGVFVGSTGVGKSSLLNALCPHVNLAVGSVGEYRSMGRHTTTVSTLHNLASGGELVDTPGFRDFGLVDISPRELALHFPGFEEAGADSCRFSDCRHRSEPGCAVLRSLREGRINEERYRTFLELLDEVEADEEKKRTRGWRS
jgi:ribosome biogenesis GTPase